ncbi:MAG: DUF3006 domain-containing protein [Defluviitaleaceae bacterium]|nr:DUF3006 domain-containing protein [Defluviitaleaceae bacterium]
MANIQFVIDHIESGIAVCEQLDTGSFREFKIALLPKGAKEGDVLNFDGTYLTLDSECTAARKEKIQGMLNRIFNKH